MTTIEEVRKVSEVSAADAYRRGVGAGALHAHSRRHDIYVHALRQTTTQLKHPGCQECRRPNSCSGRLTHPRRSVHKVAPTEPHRTFSGTLRHTGQELIKKEGRVGRVGLVVADAVGHGLRCSPR